MARSRLPLKPGPPSVSNLTKQNKWREEPPARAPGHARRHLLDHSAGSDRAQDRRGGCCREGFQSRAESIPHARSGLGACVRRKSGAPLGTPGAVRTRKKLPPDRSRTGSCPRTSQDVRTGSPRGTPTTAVAPSDGARPDPAAQFEGTTSAHEIAHAPHGSAHGRRRCAGPSRSVCGVGLGFSRPPAQPHLSGNSDRIAQSHCHRSRSIPVGYRPYDRFGRGAEVHPQ